jgi:hypothetical protein
MDTKDLVEIPDELRHLIRQKARHEYGHWVIARMLGFKPGEVTLRVLNKEGHHEGTSSIDTYRPLARTEEILDYLERRMQILFAGALAEAPDAAMVGDDYVETTCFTSGGGAHDAGKIHELIALHINLSQPDGDDPMARAKLYQAMRASAETMVFREFPLISALADRHAQKLTVLERGWGYSRENIESTPEFENRFFNTR